jgi:hypothetical protein
MESPFVTWLSLSVAGLSLVVSAITWFQTYRRQQYDTVDVMLNELLKICLEYPELRDPDFISNALTSTDHKLRLRYDAYATLVWNYLERLYETYGKGLEKNAFSGAMSDLGERHKKWFFADDHYKKYNPNLLGFLGIKR